jgi:tetratricopeptide (TPR) repeat protein
MNVLIELIESHLCLPMRTLHAWIRKSCLAMLRDHSATPAATHIALSPQRHVSFAAPHSTEVPFKGRIVRRPHIRDNAAQQSQVDDALNAISPEELRGCVRIALRQLDASARQTLEDLLVSAHSGVTGEPASDGLSREQLDDLGDFVAMARSQRWVEPEDVDQFLRTAYHFFLRRDYASARTILEHLLPPISSGNICVGDSEFDLDEALDADVDRCRGQLAVSVYMTTPSGERAEALFDTTIRMGWSSRHRPLYQMEMAAVEELADFEAFLPLWMQWLRDRIDSTNNDMARKKLEYAHREALLQEKGIAGLENHARSTRDADALRDWCRALVDAGDWNKALEAFKDSAKLLESSPALGWFLDRIAFSAQRLGRRDVAGRFEDAWRESPSADRLLRWLGAQSPSRATLRRRTTKALELCPEQDAWQLGLLEVLTADFARAAVILESARALSWSDREHGGWLLLGAFASMLSEGRPSKIVGALEDRMQRSGGIGSDALLLEYFDEEGGLELSPPTIAELIHLAGPAKSLGLVARSFMHKAMCKATKRRVDAIVGRKFRRHYDSCALLMVACLELAQVAEREKSTASWFERLRAKYPRHNAFQRELMSALRESPMAKRLIGNAL